MAWGAAAIRCALMAGGLFAVYAGVAQAQSPFPSQMPQAPKKIARPEVLALRPEAPAVRRQLTGTGFLRDDSGHVLTAQHVIDHCSRVLVGKDQQRVVAEVGVAVAARGSGAAEGPADHGPCRRLSERGPRRRQRDGLCRRLRRPAGPAGRRRRHGQCAGPRQHRRRSGHGFARHLRGQRRAGARQAGPGAGRGQPPHRLRPGRGGGHRPDEGVPHRQWPSTSTRTTARRSPASPRAPTGAASISARVTCVQY
ncbi:MAG: hypothetical protein WDN31_21150 [Hyphomicrobium sp.]